MFPHEIPDSRAIPVVAHTGFPVWRSNQLQSVNSETTSLKTHFAFQESPAASSGGVRGKLPRTYPAIQQWYWCSVCQGRLMPSPASSIIKGTIFFRQIFHQKILGTDTSSLSGTLIYNSPSHVPTHRIFTGQTSTWHSLCARQLPEVEGSTSGAILAEQRQLVQRKAGHLNMKIWNSVHLSS